MLNRECRRHKRWKETGPGRAFAEKLSDRNPVELDIRRRRVCRQRLRIVLREDFVERQLCRCQEAVVTFRNETDLEIVLGGGGSGSADSMSLLNTGNRNSDGNVADHAIARQALDGRTKRMQYRHLAAINQAHHVFVHRRGGMRSASPFVTVHGESTVVIINPALPANEAPDVAAKTEVGRVVRQAKGKADERAPLVNQFVGGVLRINSPLQCIQDVDALELPGAAIKCARVIHPLPGAGVFDLG